MSAFSSSRFFGPAVAAAAVLATTCVAQTTSAPTAPAETSQVSPRQHRPMQLLSKDTPNVSTNWSGYAVTGSSFTQSLGSWVVPTVDCKVTPNTYASFWVGLDGFNSDTVEQTGTDSDCNGVKPTYYAWYEFYPNPSIIITSLTVSPGDIISAAVNYSSGQFVTTITDMTTGKSFSKSGTVSGAERSSAEWIAEAPCCTSTGGILPLSDFGTVAFGPDPAGVTGTGITTTNYATEGSGNSMPISAFGRHVEEIFKTSQKSSGLVVLSATPSALSTDGTSFTVKWDSE